MTSLEESDGKSLTPLRFIDEIDSDHASRVTLPRVGAEVLYKQTGLAVGDTGSHPNDSILLDLIKNTLLKSGLSVTALNHFIKCPNQYIYQSILRMPQAPAVAAEKGTALHEALANVWASGEYDSGNIEKIVTGTVTEYFQKSLLSVKEKESVMKELLPDVPSIAKALVPLFAMKDAKSKVFTEVWVETEKYFNGQFSISNDLSQHAAGSDAEIRIPIHGKLDAIIDDGQEVSVFDYKAKQAMSENAIRGETKSSDGNYFRQLVFYKILVHSDPRWRNRRVSPALVFVSPDAKGRCPIISLPISDADEKVVMDHIQSLVASVWSGEIVQSHCDDVACEWCGMRSV